MAHYNIDKVDLKDLTVNGMYFFVVEEFNVEPVLNIRHDSTRKATGGLRATVQPENLLYKNGSLTGDKIELSYNEIMK